MGYSEVPHRDNEYTAIETLVTRALKGELGDTEKALDTVRRAAWTLKLQPKMVEGIIAAVKDELKGVGVTSEEAYENAVKQIKITPHPFEKQSDALVFLDAQMRSHMPEEIRTAIKKRILGTLE